MAEAWAINASGGAPEYNAQELRRITAVHLFPGVSDAFGARSGVRPHSQAVVTVSGTTWTQHNLTAVVYPGITSISGPYIVEKDSESAGLNPADGTNDRIDALDLQVRDDDEDASGFRDVRVVYVPGTPAGSPVAEPLTDNSLRLATILVSAGGSPSPTVATLAQYTVASGGILPLRDGAAFPSAGLHEGMYADQDGALWRRGTTAWAPVASPNSPTLIAHTSSGSFVKADYPWARKVKVKVQGGGGGGGGTAATGASEAAPAAGGGGGGYAEAVIDIAALESSVTITVGGGGSGGSAGLNNGSPGSNSSFGAHVIGNGGGGGQGGSNTSGSNVTDGGSGGNGSINTGVGFVRPGGPGHNGACSGGIVGNHGYGGESLMGPGARTSGTNAGGAGVAGGARGGGGSGAFASNNQSAFAGGAGFAGSVVIEVY